MQLRHKKNRVNNSGNDVIEGMCASGNGKTANCKQYGKVCTGNGSEAKLHPVERSTNSKTAIYQHDVVVRAKQSRRDKYRQHNRVLVAQLQQILEQKH